MCSSHWSGKRERHLHHQTEQTVRCYSGYTLTSSEPNFLHFFYINSSSKYYNYLRVLICSFLKDRLYWCGFFFRGFDALLIWFLFSLMSENRKKIAKEPFLWLTESSRFEVPLIRKRMLKTKWFLPSSPSLWTKCPLQKLSTNNPRVKSSDFFFSSILKVSTYTFYSNPNYKSCLMNFQKNYPVF